MEIGTFKNVHLMAEQLESYLLDQQDSKLNSFVKRNSYGKSLGRQGLNLGAYFMGIKAVLSNCPGFVRSGGGGGVISSQYAPWYRHLPSKLSKPIESQSDSSLACIEAMLK